MTPLKPVQSSNIAGIGYDAARQALVVQFKGGKTFEYVGVQSEAYAALDAAPSVGAAFASTIRPHFKGVEIK